MAEDWLRDSGPINWFLEQIGPSIRRSHINEKLCREWEWVFNNQQWQEWNIFAISTENCLMFCKVKILSNIERKMRDEELKVWKLLIANLISWLQNKMSAQKWSECEIYIQKVVRMWIFSIKNNNGRFDYIAKELAKDIFLFRLHYTWWRTTIYFEVHL